MLTIHRVHALPWARLHGCAFDMPSDSYTFYAPRDGISVRDRAGKRWRVVHNLWDTDELRSRLARLDWEMTVLGPGLFENILWASARC